MPKLALQLRTGNQPVLICCVAACVVSCIAGRTATYGGESPVHTSQESNGCFSKGTDDSGAGAGLLPNDEIVAVETFDYSIGAMRDAKGGLGWADAWQTSRLRPAEIAPFSNSDNGEIAGVTHLGTLIRGTARRNNPLRRAFAQPHTASEFFFRFDIRYEQSATQLTEAGADVVTEIDDPEFFVCWLDQVEGNDTATHAAGVPNFGIHVASDGPDKGKNVFMLRVGVENTVLTRVALEYGRTYRIVGRIARSSEDEGARYDQFDLWIDPQLDEEASPDASLRGVQSLDEIRWIGFASAIKTEAGDRIHLGDLVCGESWNSIFHVQDDWLRQLSGPFDHYVRLDRQVDFTDDVFPLLEARCLYCHEGDNPDSGYRLDLRSEWLGYSNGEVLAEPGQSHLSRLIERVQAEDDSDRMPPDGDTPLSDEEVVLLRTWIDQGMTWDDELLPPVKRESNHWAFQPIVRPEVPRTSRPEWIANPIDAFIASAHEQRELTPSDPASKSTLVRRLYLDVIGLPPTAEEVRLFLDDESPDAYASLVERLLDSPHYGERWGRYWLDLARWAESQGYQHDIVRPYAWRYRNYVIDSFNSDKPYDRFLREQLAGDELQPYSDENVIATGFLAAARISGNEEDPRIQRNDVLVDIVNTTGSAILGLTLECAQCHNHKFDPISQRDYYRLQAFFVKGQLGNLSLQESHQDDFELATWIPRDALDFYRKEIASLERNGLYQDFDQPHTWGYLSAATGDPRIERLSVVNRKPILWDPELLKSEMGKILVRGDVSIPGHMVEPGWPEVIGITPSSIGNRPRTALADWLTGAENPLVARVWVNRLWQYHFGRGIVATASDFGVEGSPPSHPELLDWLATELMEEGWSTKHIHRLILLSSTYRQQQQSHDDNARLDPHNVYLWRWPGRRLQAEVIRDSTLVATGELDRTIGGTSIVPDTEELFLRRTIYLFQQRSSMPAVMDFFDAPSGISSCSGRDVSTVALQPLYLLNSEFMARRAGALAHRCLEQAGTEIDDLIYLAFEYTLARTPDARELELARMFFDDQEPQRLVWFESPQRPLAQLCLALMNLNEFVYIP